jgi:quinolinate synthase
MDASVETPISAGALHDKLAVLGNESYSAETCTRYADMIAEIKQLKRARRAVVLAHNYQPYAEILPGSELVGLSLIYGVLPVYH